MMNLDLSESIFKMLDTLVKKTLEDMKEDTTATAGKFQPIHLQKLMLCTSFLEEIITPSFKNILIHNRLSNLLVKLYKTVVDEDIVGDLSELYKLLLLKLKNSLLRLFIKLYDPLFSMAPETTLLGFDVPTVEDHQTLLKLINLSLRVPEIGSSKGILKEQLEACLLSLKVCLSTSKSLPTQTVILYG